MNFKNIHSWDVSPKAAIDIQNDLRKKIILKARPIKIRLIAGVDAAFDPSTTFRVNGERSRTIDNRKATAAVVILSFPGLRVIEIIRKTAKVRFPYIPGLLTFREGQVLEVCFKEIKNEPDIIIFDGQGIAHPRNMGIATHMGILLDRPTIGCAKSWLYGDYLEPKKSAGSFSYLLGDKKRKIGVVLRTKDNVKPVFVSPGYKIDIENSIKTILKCTLKYRLPEPLRLAHQLAAK